MSSKSATWNWICKKVDTNDVRKYSPREKVSDHPLKYTGIKMKDGDKSRMASSRVDIIKTSATFSDPLGLVKVGDDPLSVFQKKNTTVQLSEDNWNVCDLKPTRKGELEPWNVRKEAILIKYSTSEILPMASSFSLQDRGNSILRGKMSQQNDFEEGISYQIHDITPQDYYHQIESFHQEVIVAWNEDQKVKALKIVIQCSKLLSNSDTVSFYPNKFVYITNVLDTFGDLVYSRLKSKCECASKHSTAHRVKSLSNGFTLDMVPEPAKETCRNWFYKIASIRELIPRFYVEAALLGCYSFITHREQGKVLLRLTKMIRGIGNPLVAAFARCYLCRIGVALNVNDFSFFKENLYEFMLSYEHIFNRNMHLSKRMDISKYLDAFTPALDYIMVGVVSSTSSNVHDEIFKMCKAKIKNSLLLYSILSSFTSSYVISHVSEILDWISEVNNEAGIPTYKLLEELGEHFQMETLIHQFSISSETLNNVWKIISTIRNADHYISCVELWMPISVSYFTIYKVNNLLGDIINHLNHDLLYELYYTRLHNIWRGMLENVTDFLALFVMENFMSFIDLFHCESAKTPVCKMVLEYFVKRTPTSIISDSVVLENLMYIAKTLHDSINALTVDDEKRQIGHLICNSIIRIDFGHDFENQLTFYVDARGSFFNFDIVHTTLVQCVNRMSIEVLNAVKGRHTSKTASFVRACAAYCFITIPSIASELTRFQLYLISGQVALANQCYGQADSCFGAILDLIAAFPHSIEIDGKQRSTEPILISYISEFISILLILPDSPSQGPLHLLRRLINVLQQYLWEEHSTGKTYLYIQALHMLGIAAQESYPYHIPGVDSNDMLYNSDPNFIAEVNKISSIVLDQILKNLQTFDTGPDLKKQFRTWFIVVAVMIRFFEAETV